MKLIVIVVCYFLMIELAFSQTTTTTTTTLPPTTTTTTIFNWHPIRVCRVMLPGEAPDAYETALSAWQATHCSH